MDNYEPLITGVLGALFGSFGVTVFSWVTTRRQGQQNLQKTQDERLIKWRDDCIHLSEELLEKNLEISRQTQAARLCVEEKRILENAVRRCKEKLKSSEEDFDIV